ncbi:glycosyltransferase family 2 protein [Halalkalicoccus subterraneus]|uniref:glycosyltransferase family 2 protein n=1 Tax=Halalkalicoccus subterraneus TaxID=2675002 RepID=UPI000EFCBD08|nr:glycosyltransferase family 2 protein [Halalkalicoccus subterraneus]
MPVVSVVIPTYNRAGRLGRAIESVLAGRFEDYEIVVVDDGSTDDTEAVVTGYDDGRVRYVYQENAGANTARNRGVAESRGEFVSFLDSDDEFHPETLEVAVDTLRGEPDSCAGIATSYRKIRDGEVYAVIEAVDGRITREDIVDANVIGGFSCTTFRREVFDRVGGLREGLASSQDYEFYLRVLTESDYYMVGVPRVLVDYHAHGEQITADIDRKMAGQQFILEEYGDVISDKRRAQHHYLRGTLYADTGKMDRARAEFKRAIGTDPTYYLYYFRYLTTYLGKGGYDRAEAARNRVKLALRRATG